MRERDMRQRVERFLQTRLRKMLAPATLGLGLAMTGCPSGGMDSSDDAAALVKKDANADAGAVAVYSAPVSDDAAPQKADSGDVPSAVPMYGTPIRDAGADAARRTDSGPALRYMAQMPDATPDLGNVLALYMAALPESQS